jgi:uncharacterized protein (TIGR03437 family)
MNRLSASLAVALWFSAAVWGQAPSYNAAGIVNTCNQTQGPYAPNTVLSILGTGLAYSALGLTAGDVAGGSLPTQLNGVQVMVDGSPAPVFYVSPTQVNFLMPPNLTAGPVTVWTTLNSYAGPQVTLTLQPAAPALFPSATDAGYAIAQQWPAYTTISPESPVAPGGIVILYAAGLGPTTPTPALPNEIMTVAGPITQMASFQVLLNGTPLNAAQVLYAGICPGWAGLYQVDLILPQNVGPNPAIQVAVGGQVSAAGLKLAVE